MSKENNISGGFRTPLYGELIGMSTCSICKNRIKGGFQCKVYGNCLKEIKESNVAVCPHEDINTESPVYSKFIEIREKQSKTI